MWIDANGCLIQQYCPTRQQLAEQVCQERLMSLQFLYSHHSVVCIMMLNQQKTHLTQPANQILYMTAVNTNSKRQTSQCIKNCQTWHTNTIVPAADLTSEFHCYYTRIRTTSLPTNTGCDSQTNHIQALTNYNMQSFISYKTFSFQPIWYILRYNCVMEGTLPDAHGESVDVFVQLIQQSDGLDDHVVNPVDIKLDFSSGVAVAKTQLCLGGSRGSQTLHQGMEVQTHTWQERGQIKGFVGVKWKSGRTACDQWLFRFSV